MDGRAREEEEEKMLCTVVQISTRVRKRRREGKTVKAKNHLLHAKKSNSFLRLFDFAK